MTTEQTTIDEEISTLEKEILEKHSRLHELKKSRPAEEVHDYTFKDRDGNEVNLSDMFGDKDELIVVHNMGRSCTYCTLWADGFNGLHHHLENRAGFVVTSPDTPEIQKQFADSRGWKFKLYSGAETTFIEDMGYKQENSYWPGFSVFQKTEDGRILRTAKDFFGPGDLYCSLWHMFDLLPKGENGWQPKYTY